MATTRPLLRARPALLLGVEDRIAEPDQRLFASILAREHAQRLEACHRRQHAHGMALEQPGSVAIGGEIARRIHLRHRDRGLLRHQQMERQRRERARGHHDEMPLVLDQRLDRTDERLVKLVREAEIEQLAGLGGAFARQPRSASSHSFATIRPHRSRQPALLRFRLRALRPLQSARQRVHIEPAPERRDLLRQRLCRRAELFSTRTPRASARRRRFPNVRRASQKTSASSSAEQVLHLLGLERPWVRQRRIVGKLPFEPRRVGGELALGLGNLLCGWRRSAAGRCWPSGLDKRRDQRLVALAPEGGEVLALAHQRGKRIAAGGKAQAHLLDRRRGSDWFAHCAITKASRPHSGRGSSRFLRRGRKIGDMTNKVVRALRRRDRPRPAFCRAPVRLGGCMSDDGSRRLARDRRARSSVSSASAWPRSWPG